MPVSAPLFYLGYKEVIPREEGTRCRTAEELAAAEVLLDLLAGKASPLYARLMDEGLINAQFGADYFEGPGYAVWLFAGESRDPDAVRRPLKRSWPAPDGKDSPPPILRRRATPCTGG